MYLLCSKVTPTYEQYPFLREEPRFKQIHLYCQVARPIMYFETGEEEEGLAAFAEIEPTLSNLNDGSEQSITVLGNLSASSPVIT